MNDKIRMNEKELTDIIEKRLIEKYKRKFTGVIFGFVVGFSVIGFFGYDVIIKSLETKIVEELTTGSFKDDIIKQVSLKISKETNGIYSDIKKSQEKAQNIVKEMEEDHESLVDSATIEFKRTIEVLNKVRENYEK